jgi:hypothetical protein
MTVGKTDDPKRFVTVDLEDYQGLKDVEDRISDAMLCFDSMLDTLSTFKEMHQRYFVRHGTCEQADEAASPDMVVTDKIMFILEEKQREVAFVRKKAEAMLSKAQNTRALVSRIRCLLIRADETSDLIDPGLPDWLQPPETGGGGARREYDHASECRQCHDYHCHHPRISSLDYRRSRYRPINVSRKTD